MFTVATWNVNSLRMRHEQVFDWLATTQCDVLCLQELKMDTPLFPEEAFKAAGFHCAWIGQKAYNGVAIISRFPILEITAANNPHYPDAQQRIIACLLDTPLGPVNVMNVYCPCGSVEDLQKFKYKLEWYAGLMPLVEQHMRDYPQFVLTGDFNIAPTADDVHPGYQGKLLVSPPERAYFKQLQGMGLIDAFRCFPQASESYSWWDYRQAALQRNRGFRIDHIMVSPALSSHLKGCEIDKAPRHNPSPSDHTPVVATFAD